MDTGGEDLRVKEGRGKWELIWIDLHKVKDASSGNLVKNSGYLRCSNEQSRIPPVDGEGGRNHVP